MSIQREELPLSARDLCFLDIETTGSVFGFHEIIDIAAVRTDPSGMDVRGIWQRRVKPRNPERVTELAQTLTGFDPEPWATASESNTDFWYAFGQFVNGCVPVCHNPSFERAFITLAAGAQGIQDLGLDYHWIGTESLAWPLYLNGFLRKLSLVSLCEYLGVGTEPYPHRAVGGAQACRRAYLAIISRLSSAAVQSEIAV